jgi:Uma2 family endonuclease
MENIPQATQRKITLECFDLIHRARPEIQLFSELLIQYPIVGQRKPGQLVPDNMVVVHPEPIVAHGHYNTAIQPVKPYMVIEYVSQSSEHKDYVLDRSKYERELQIPFYMLFHSEDQELTLLKLERGKYREVKRSAEGRFPIPKLEIEIGMPDDWARFWFRGKLVPLPDELEEKLEESESARLKAERDAKKERKARLEAEQELAKLRAALEKANGKG